MNQPSNLDAALVLPGGGVIYKRVQSIGELKTPLDAVRLLMRGQPAVVSLDDLGAVLTAIEAVREVTP